MMKIQAVQIDQIKFDTNNARVHDQKNLEAIQGSLEKFGQRKPIVIDHLGNIVAGNGTVEAAMLLGWTEIDAVTVPKEWDAETIQAFALADNRTAELATWNKEVMASQLLELQEAGFDIQALGFDLQVEEVEEQTTEDEIPEVPETAITKLGDLWILGNHRLICGDATDANSIAKLFENRIAELCFTSPPYAEQRDYNGGKKLSTEHIASFISVASNLCQFFVVNLGISRKNNQLIRYWDDYILAAENSGLKLISWNVWNRQGLSGFSIGQLNAMFAIEHEWIFVFGKQAKKLNQTVENKTAGADSAGSRRKKDGSFARRFLNINSMRQMGTIYSGGVENNPEGNHPATFPIDFPVSYIEAMTNEQDYVFEPFAGSGTTMIAAERLNRKCLAVELDPKYCDVIIQRWENLTGEKARLDNASR